jgi:hypothetical protein
MLPGSERTRLFVRPSAAGSSRKARWSSAGARIDQVDLDAIRDRVSVVDLIAKHVGALTDKGGHSVALCPFHSEQTPSFTVWPDHYNCFGCGAHGDVIEAAMRLGKLSFRAAVDRLRRDAGIDRALTAEERQELERQRKARERQAAEAAAAKLRAAKRIIRECRFSASSGVVTYLTARDLPLYRRSGIFCFTPPLSSGSRTREIRRG